jgi:hypothetical protein
MNYFGLGQSAERSLYAWRRRRFTLRAGGKRRLDDQTQVQTRAQHCLVRGIASQQASRSHDFPVAKTSTAYCESPGRSPQWFVEPLDQPLVTKVNTPLTPVRNKDWF